MDRRFLTVLGVSLVFALVVSSIFYQMVGKAGPTQQSQVKTDLKDLVVAVKPISVGVIIKPDDVKLTKVSTDAFPKGGFGKVEEVVSRPVISNILQDEPIIEGRLALRGNQGLPSLIPVGMRAVPIRVNEVVGVAGFVMPGMKVDVLTTGRPPSGEGTVTTTVLQNMQVLSAGQAIQADSRGQPINATTVTLLCTPEQAETLTLAGSEGRIQLILRNGNDNELSKTAGREVGQLFGGYTKAPSSKLKMTNNSSNNSVDDNTVAPVRRPKPVVRRQVQADPVPMALAPPPPPPPPSEIVEFRGNIKTIGTVAPRAN